MIENSRKLLFMSLGVLLLMIAISSFLEMERTLTKLHSSMIDHSRENQWLSVDEDILVDNDKVYGRDIRSLDLKECALIYKGDDIKWLIDFYEGEETYIQYKVEGVSEEYPDIIGLIEDDDLYMIWQEEEVISIVCR